MDTSPPILKQIEDALRSPFVSKESVRLLNKFFRERALLQVTASDGVKAEMFTPNSAYLTGDIRREACREYPDSPPSGPYPPNPDDIGETKTYWLNPCPDTTAAGHFVRGNLVPGSTVLKDSECWDVMGPYNCQQGSPVGALPIVGDCDSSDCGISTVPLPPCNTITATDTVVYSVTAVGIDGTGCGCNTSEGSYHFRIHEISGMDGTYIAMVNKIYGADSLTFNPINGYIHYTRYSGITGTCQGSTEEVVELSYPHLTITLTPSCNLATGDIELVVANSKATSSYFLFHWYTGTYEPLPYIASSTYACSDFSVFNDSATIGVAAALLA